MENLETVINELRTEIKLIQQSLERIVKAVEEDKIAQRLAVLEDRDTSASSKIIYFQKEMDSFKWKIISAYGAIILLIVGLIFEYIRG